MRVTHREAHFVLVACDIATAQSFLAHGNKKEDKLNKWATKREYGSYERRAASCRAAQTMRQYANAQDWRWLSFFPEIGAGTTDKFWALGGACMGCSVNVIVP